MARVFAVLTGASRGYGEALAPHVASHLARISDAAHLVLVSRSGGGTAQKQATELGQGKVSVSEHHADLGNLDSLQHDIDAILAQVCGSTSNRHYIFATTLFGGCASVADCAFFYV